MKPTSLLEIVCEQVLSSRAVSTMILSGGGRVESKLKATSATPILMTVMVAASQAIPQNRDVRYGEGENGMAIKKVMATFLTGLPSLALALALSGSASQAQNSNTRNGQAFTRFWAEFKTAVAKGDKQAVASMTKLPFMLSNKSLKEADFIRKYDSIFDKKVRACFAKAKPVKDDEIFEVFCGEEIFIFGKIGGKYKFIEISAND
jgi:hypothetical protein